MTAEETEEGGTEHWRDQDECQGCGSERGPLRAIKMRSGGRDLLCVGCFMDAFDEGKIDPSDPRVEGNEAYIGTPAAPRQRGGLPATVTRFKRGNGRG